MLLTQTVPNTESQLVIVPLLQSNPGYPGRAVLPNTLAGGASSSPEPGGPVPYTALWSPAGTRIAMISKRDRTRSTGDAAVRLKGVQDHYDAYVHNGFAERRRVTTDGAFPPLSVTSQSPLHWDPSSRLLAFSQHPQPLTDEQIQQLNDIAAQLEVHMVNVQAKTPVPPIRLTRGFVDIVIGWR